MRIATITHLLWRGNYCSEISEQGGTRGSLIVRNSVGAEAGETNSRQRQWGGRWVQCCLLLLMRRNDRAHRRLALTHPVSQPVQHASHGKEAAPCAPTPGTDVTAVLPVRLESYGKEVTSCATLGPDLLEHSSRSPLVRTSRTDKCLPGKRGLSAKMLRSVTPDGRRHSPPPER